MSTVIRLLILEDHGDDAELIQATLARAGVKFIPEVVSTKEGFIDALESFVPEFILSDHHLLNFSSGEALLICREKFPYMPFILVTGTASDEFAASIIKAGADDYILKGNLKRLPTAIQQAVEKKRTEELLRKSEANLRTIFDTTDTAFILLDSQSVVLSFNKPAHKIIQAELGLTLDEGKTIMSSVRADRQDFISETIKSVLEGSSVEYDWEFKYDVTSRWYHLRFNPVRGAEHIVIGVCLAITNITESKNSEKKLIESERRFRALIENSADAILLADIDVIVSYQSPAAERMTGISLQQRLENPGIQYIHRDDVPVIKKVINESLQCAGNPIPFESRFLHANGHYIWIEGVVTNLLSEASVHAIVINYRDISDRKAAARKLESSEQRFRALIENSSDAIVLNDENAKIIYQSPSVTKIFGYTSQEREGKQALNYIHSEDREDFVRLYEEVRKSPRRPVAFQYRFRHKNGHYIWLEGVLTNLLQDVSVNAIVVNYRDITERKDAEEAIELTLNRFKLAQEIAHLGHWERDLATSITRWSDEEFRILGMEPGSVEPSQELFLAQIHPDDVERVTYTIGRAVRTLSSFSMDHRVILPTGSIRSLHTVAQFEYDKSKKPLRLYGVSLDVTELTEKEKKLEQANKDLATFIYKASHDLRSPIASVLGLLNIAKAEVKDEKALQYFAMVNEVVLKQNRMLVNLINIMSMRDRQLICGSIKMQKVLDDVLESLKSMEGYERIRFTIHQKLEEPLVSDEELMKIILSQLIDNSILYSSGPNPEIRISISLDENKNLLLEVVDNGVGMPEDVANRVFDMFYRGSVLSRGSGLGLFLVKNAVEKMGGSISASSEENKGSTFKVKLPAMS